MIINFEPPPVSRSPIGEMAIPAGALHLPRVCAACLVLSGFLLDIRAEIRQVTARRVRPIKVCVGADVYTILLDITYLEGCKNYQTLARTHVCSY